MAKTKPSGLPLFRQSLDKIGLSTEARDIVMASWRSSTCKQYYTYLARWETYCNERGITTFQPTIYHGIEFLADLYKRGLGYSAINTARSALSTITPTTNGTFGNHPLVVRFMKGVYEMKPSLPRYTLTSYVGKVLTFLANLPPNPSLKQLTMKLTMLLSLITGQRCQTLSKLDTRFMQRQPDKYIFTIRETLKTSKPGRHIDPIELNEYKADQRLCVVQLITLYLAKTSEIRKPDVTKLLISYAKPHKTVKSATIGKWVKSTMKDAGIDTTIFSAHSGRSASTSYAKSAGIPLADILKAGGWSNAQTFAKYYDKPLSCNFGTSILDHYSQL